MKTFQLKLQATLDPDQTEKDFNSLFISGKVVDGDLNRRISELSRMFNAYSNSCPAPFWARGVAVTDEMCRVTETYLDFDTIRRALARLQIKSLKVPCVEPPLITRANGWIRFLNTLPLFNDTPDPSTLIAHLADDENDRKRFFFSLNLPEHFGGSFGRYPGQLDFLTECAWQMYGDESLPVHCLDAACGSGEGSYELAGALLDCGIDHERISVTGISISPLEVLAAAHACFPHDPVRQKMFRQKVRQIAGGKGEFPDIQFAQGDLKQWEPTKRYRIILCNGIIGGPLMHDRSDVAKVVSNLADSLEPDGIFLVADRFHEGWRKKLPRTEIENLLAECGLDILGCSEGVAGVKKGYEEFRRPPHD